MVIRMVIIYSYLYYSIKTVSAKVNYMDVYGCDGYGDYPWLFIWLFIIFYLQRYDTHILYLSCESSSV